MSTNSWYFHTEQTKSIRSSVAKSITRTKRILLYCHCLFFDQWSQQRSTVPNIINKWMRLLRHHNWLSSLAMRIIDTVCFDSSPFLIILQRKPVFVVLVFEKRFYTSVFTVLPSTTMAQLKGQDFKRTELRNNLLLKKSIGAQILHYDIRASSTANKLWMEWQPWPPKGR